MSNSGQHLVETKNESPNSISANYCYVIKTKNSEFLYAVLSFLMVNSILKYLSEDKTHLQVHYATSNPLSPGPQLVGGSLHDFRNHDFKIPS